MPAAPTTRTRQPEPSGSASSGTAPTETPADEETPASTGSAAGARKALRTGQRQLFRANTGNIAVGVPLFDGIKIKDVGDYQIRPLRADLLRTITSDDGEVAFRYLTSGRSTWIRLVSVDGDDESGWPCWVDLAQLSRQGELPDGTQLAAPGQPPVGLVAAGLGRATGFVDGGTNEVVGSTDLYSALGLVGGAKLIAASGLSVEDDAVVPARFQLNGDMLIGFEVDFEEIPRALASSGAVDPDPLIASLTLAEGQLVAFFADIGRPVDIVAPRPDEVVDLDEGGDFESVMRSCARGPETT